MSSLDPNIISLTINQNIDLASRAEREDIDKMFYKLDLKKFKEFIKIKENIFKIYNYKIYNSKLNDMLKKIMKKDKVDILTILLNNKYYAVNNEPNYSTLLMLSSYHGGVLCTIELLNRGACVNSVNYKKITPLMMACKKNNFKVAKELIINNANIKLKNIFGEDAYNIAFNKRNYDICKLIGTKLAYLRREELNIKKYKKKVIKEFKKKFKPLY